MNSKYRENNILMMTRVDKKVLPLNETVHRYPSGEKQQGSHEPETELRSPK